MRQERLPVDAALLEGLLENRVGHVFRRPGGDRRLDEDEAVGAHLRPDDPQAVLQRRDVGRSLPAVSQRFLVVVALDIHHDRVGQRQGVVGVRGHQCLLPADTPLNEGGHFGVLRLNGRDPLVEVSDLPEGPRGGALHPDDEFPRLAGFPVRRVRDDSGHDGADEP